MFPNLLSILRGVPPNDDSGAAPKSISLLRGRMAAGWVPKDRDFDHYLSAEGRGRSGQYWTPLGVCARAAEWFEELDIRSVCDIGSGAGKFCVATSLFGHATFVGLEHRQSLVAESRCLAELFGVSTSVRFVHGALGEVTLAKADAYYFFNPFEENVFSELWCLDQGVELSPERQLRDIDRSYRLLDDARIGTYVLTYNGYGGALPAKYRRVREDLHQRNELSLWQKCA